MPRFRPVMVVLVTLALFAVAFWNAPTAEAHAELVRADPPSEGVLAVPPGELEFWFSESVASDGGSPSIQVLDQTGATLAASGARVDPADATHVIGDVPTLAPGVFTVVWSVRSATDGHTLGGSYAFRVGAGRVPGAATVDGERPRAWAVATRWLTFLGAALAAGGFAFAWLMLRSGDDSAAGMRARVAIMAGGALTGLLASLSEPFAQTRWPPHGVVAPKLGDAVAGLPAAWWLRPAGFLVALACALVVARSLSRKRFAPGPVAWVGLAAGLTVLLGLALTSHAGGRASWRWAALTSNALHQLCVALWVGGLVHLTVWWAGARAMNRTAVAPVAIDAPVRRFSRAALCLVIVAVATGVLNAGLILPTARSLWSSAYGVTILIKVGILVLQLALAVFNRRALGGAVSRLRPAVQRAVRLEAGLVLIVVLVGSLLALSGPPTVEAELPATADVPMPALAAYQGQDLLVHLRFTPGRARENAFTVQLSNYDRSAFTGKQPSLVRLRYVSLGTEATSAPVSALLTPDGWLADGTAMTLDGWWRVEVTLRWLGQADVVVPFHLLMPDPNLNGMDAPRTAATDPAAAELYASAMVAHTGMHRVRFTQVMASHTGFASLAEEVVNDGADGSVPGFTYTARGGWNYVVIGTTTWTQLPGKAWRVDEGYAMTPPSRWDDEYLDATGFQFGRVETVNGEACQALTFVVPGTPKQVVARYVWWVGLESGAVKQEMMVSRSHYMFSVFTDIDAPLAITPPLDASGAPIATSQPGSE